MLCEKGYVESKDNLKCPYRCLNNNFEIPDMNNYAANAVQRP